MESWSNAKIYLFILKMWVGYKGWFSPAILPSLSTPSSLLKVLFGFSVNPGMFLLFSNDFNDPILSILEVLGNRWSHC